VIWNNEDYAHLRNAMGRHASPEETRASLEAIASCAVQLVAARGGMMKAEDLEPLFGDIEHRFAMTAVLLRQHIAVQGACVAVLEAECASRIDHEKELEALLQETRSERDVLLACLKPSWQVAIDVRNGLVRLAARAQEAEALRSKVEGLVENYRCATQDRDSAMTEVERLKEQVARLSAAGQVLSEHADRAADGDAEAMRTAIRKDVAEWAQAALGEVPRSLLLVIDGAAL
jgi:DNA repair exonuclease SbcCD ATPase subunit